MVIELASLEDGAFQKELCSLLNRYSCEKVSGTPDFILAEYLVECLKTYNEAVSKRAEWYGGHAEFKPSLGVPNGSS